MTESLPDELYILSISIKRSGLAPSQCMVRMLVGIEPNSRNPRLDQNPQLVLAIVAAARNPAHEPNGAIAFIPNQRGDGPSILSGCALRGDCDRGEVSFCVLACPGPPFRPPRPASGPFQACQSSGRASDVEDPN